MRQKSLMVALMLVTLLVLPMTAAGQESAAPEGSKRPRSVLLASPGVTFITASANLKVRLTYSNPLRISGLSQITERYWTDIATGSGFVVTPDGAIVTASHVVDPPMKTLRTYGANMMLMPLLGYNVDDYYEQYRITDNFVLNRLLQQCYKGVACEFTVKPDIWAYTGKEIAGTEYPTGVRARVIHSTGFQETDVAVLQVEGSNMPTVPLAESATVQTGDELTALGFPGSMTDLPTGMTEPSKLFGRVSNVRTTGTGQQIEADIDLEPGMSGGPVINSDGEVIGLTSYRRLQATGESGAAYLRPVADIKAALASAGISATRGITDESYEEAVDMYLGDHYTAAVEGFRAVLALYDGHPLAKDLLAESQALAGGPQDVPVPVEEKGTAAGEESGTPGWIIPAAVGAAVVLLGGLFFMLRSRKKKVALATPGVMTTPSTSVSETPTVTTAPVVTEPAAEVVSKPMTKEPGVVDMATGQEAHFCGHCGQKVVPEDIFCEHCGHPLHHAEAG